MSKVDDVIGELNELTVIELPEDILDDGFAKTNKALAAIQEHTVKAVQLTNVLLGEVATKRKQRNALKLKYDIQKAEVLATDDDVKAGKNAGEREAVADGKVKKERLEYEKAEAAFREVEALVLAAEHTLSALKIAKELAGRQLEVVDKEIQLGLITPESMGGN